MPKRQHGHIRTYGSPTRRTKEILQQALESQPFASDVYGSFKGRKYGSWITDSGRSVGYATTDYIDQPAYIIESILRDELGLTSSEIDTTSFDVVGNSTNGTRDGWVFARSINAVENSIDILTRLCFESHCLLFEGSDGKYKLVALDTDTSTTNLLVESQMNLEPQLSRTPLGTVFNQFDIGYSYTYATGTFEKSFVCDEATSSFEDYTELVTNGTFDSDVNGWTDYGTGSRALSSGAMVITSNAANDGQYQTAIISFESGKTYHLKLDHTIGGGSTWKIRLPKTASHSGTILGGFTEQTLAPAAFEYWFTATETADAYLLFYCTSAGTPTLTLDNITFQQVEFDYTSFTPDETSTIISYGANASTSLCGISQSRYLWTNKFQEDLIWIYDDTTAKYLTKKLIEWLYTPKLMLTVRGWRGNSFTTGYKPLISYELGDQCKIDHPILDPDISNSYIFMVVGKVISLNNIDVTLTLMQMR